MAILSADKKYIRIEGGDTLSEIVSDPLIRACITGATGNIKKDTMLVAARNGIKNVDLIPKGGTLNLVDTAGGSATAPVSTEATKATIKQFGIQSNSQGTMFATWDWERSNTANYEVEWTYDTGDSVWFVGTKSTTEDQQSTYSIPSNAKRVRFRVKPVSKTYTSNNKETTYWTASWTSYKLCTVADITPPSVPPVPTVEIDKYKLTATLDNLNVNANTIEFKVVKNDSTTYKTGKATIKTSHASFSCNVDAGGNYKVACRSYNGEEYSAWSDYSANVTTIPATPAGITACRANSETSVYLEWAAVTSAKSYNIEFTTKKQYFDGSDQVTSVTGITSTHYEKTGLTSGQEYFFRVQAVNEKGESSWSGIASVIIGKKPAAPTTWSSTTTAITGEELTLYWIHNSEDGSSQTYADLELYINGVKETHTIKNTTNEEEKDKTSFYKINTSSYIEGTKIQWRVRTAGITNTYGDWSIQRTVDIYAPATLELHMIDVNSNEIQVLESFPCYISGLAGPSTQLPIGYHLTVKSNEVYETVDRIGNPIIVNKGEEVYSRYFDITDSLMVELSAGNIDLENNVSYTVSCTVSMNSGLTAEASLDFTVAWTDEKYQPNAEISLDKETYVTHIRPVCESHNIVIHKVNLTDSNYVVTSEIIDGVYGEPVENGLTDTGNPVYSGVTSDGDDVYYCMIEDVKVIEDVTLSVYRREFDGGFTELATGLVSGKDTFITDPHPALDYARYRIVAVTNSTGAVSYTDLAGYPVGGNAVIIQWDEAWTSFDVTNDDALAEPAWAGSMLKLPYNIDVSDASSPDVELVEYIGREHPVSYYGTQRGFTSTWNVEIEKDDEETLYGLRRLQNWMGDAYVREPSGSGYWANVTVSFSQKHRDLVIPVTLSIKRVEGGI